MIHISMKTSPALLLGLYFLFVVKSTRATTPGTNKYNSPRPPTTVHGLRNEKLTLAATVGLTQEAAKASITATAGHTVQPTGKMEKNEEVDVNTRSSSLSDSTVTWGTAAADATTRLLLLKTTTPAEQQNTLVKVEANQTESQHQQLTTSFSSLITPGPTLAESSTQTIPVTQLENTFESSTANSLVFKSTSTQITTNTSELSPTTSSVFNSPANQITTNTSEAAPVFKTTSSPEMLFSTEVSPSSQADLAISNTVSTSQAREMTESSSTSTSISTDSATSTTSFSTSTLGILIPVDAKKTPPTKPAKTTTKAPPEVSEGPSVTDVQSCSTYGVVKQCLIIIASLAALSTIFIISTIALCVRLSSRKYKVKKSQQGTEMMCISSLLPERNYPYTRQRNPVSNGVLVLPGPGDSDEDVGDNLTLSSFLPDNDHYV